MGIKVMAVSGLAALTLVAGGGAKGCGTGSYGDGGGNTSPPTSRATDARSGYICYRCKGIRLVWIPRAAVPPVMPGGLEVCPRCKGQGNS